MTEIPPSQRAEYQACLQLSYPQRFPNPFRRRRTPLTCRKVRRRKNLNSATLAAPNLSKSKRQTSGVIRHGKTAIAASDTQTLYAHWDLDQ